MSAMNTTIFMQPVAFQKGPMALHTIMAPQTSAGIALLKNKAVLVKKTLDKWL